MILSMWYLPRPGDRHVDGVGVAEQVVQVAEALLVGAHQEDAQVVRLAGLELVQVDGVAHVVEVDELVDLAVGVAGDVAQRRLAGRPLVEPVHRAHREELLDRPVVRQALEDREVAVVGVGDEALEALQLVGHVVEAADDLDDAVQIDPEHALDQGPVGQRHEADVEQRQRLVADLQGVVVGLLEVLDDSSCSTSCMACDGLRRLRRADRRAGCPPAAPRSPGC